MLGICGLLTEILESRMQCRGNDEGDRAIDGMSLLVARDRHLPQPRPKSFRTVQKGDVHSKW